MFHAEKYRRWLQRPTLEKKDAAAPDYAPLAESSRESAEIMAGLGREQLDFAKLQYDDAKPVYDKIATSQLALMDEATRQGQDYYDYQVNTFRPLEQGLVDAAQSYNTDAHREQLAAQAAADAARAFSNNQGALSRSMASMGVNPNSGRYASVANQNALGLAAGRAGAMNNTRQQAENIGYARSMDAVGLGRNLAGASTGAYGLALNSGNAAGGNTSAPGAQYMAGMAQGAGTIGSGLQMQNQGLANILNVQSGVYGANSNKSDPFGTILGMGLGGWASGGFKF